jgi:hypothetical protein
MGRNFGKFYKDIVWIHPQYWMIKQHEQINVKSYMGISGHFRRKIGDIIWLASK